MSYSCTDFVDSILDALGVEVPEESWDSPADQADLAIAEIERLQRAAPAAGATPASNARAALAHLRTARDLLAKGAAHPRPRAPGHHELRRRRAPCRAEATMKKTVTIYGIDVQLPARWVICSHCQGSAKSSSYLGAFTASEWQEQDDDFKEDYMAGRYDRPCEPCAGLGRVQVIDAKACTGWRNRILLKAYREQERSNREIDAIQAAERAMGA